MSEQYRKSPRARFVLYNDGDYFVTICTRDMHHYFGHVAKGVMVLNELGSFAFVQLQQAHDMVPWVWVPSFIVMPNHVHAIVRIGGSKAGSTEVEHRCQRLPSLSRYVGAFKGAVTRYAKRQAVDFGWQERYHDRAIRNGFEGRMIEEYIRNNPKRWGATHLP